MPTLLRFRVDTFDQPWTCVLIVGGAVELVCLLRVLQLLRGHADMVKPLLFSARIAALGAGSVAYTTLHMLNRGLDEVERAVHSAKVLSYRSGGKGAPTSNLNLNETGETIKVFGAFKGKTAKIRIKSGRFGWRWTPPN